MMILWYFLHSEVLRWNRIIIIEVIFIERGYGGGKGEEVKG